MSDSQDLDNSLPDDDPTPPLSDGSGSGWNPDQNFGAVGPADSNGLFKDTTGNQWSFGSGTGRADSKPPRQPKPSGPFGSMDMSGWNANPGGTFSDAGGNRVGFAGQNGFNPTNPTPDTHAGRPRGGGASGWAPDPANGAPPAPAWGGIDDPMNHARADSQSLNFYSGHAQGSDPAYLAFKRQQARALSDQQLQWNAGHRMFEALKHQNKDARQLAAGQEGYDPIHLAGDQTTVRSLLEELARRGLSWDTAIFDKNAAGYNAGQTHKGLATVGRETLPADWSTWMTTPAPEDVGGSTPTTGRGNFVSNPAPRTGGDPVGGWQPGGGQMAYGGSFNFDEHTGTYRSNGSASAPGIPAREIPYRAMGPGWPATFGEFQALPPQQRQALKQQAGITTGSRISFYDEATRAGYNGDNAADRYAGVGGQQPGGGWNPYQPYNPTPVQGGGQGPYQNPYGAGYYSPVGRGGAQYYDFGIAADPRYYTEMYRPWTGRPDYMPQNPYQQL